MIVLLIKIFPGGWFSSSFKVAVSSRLSPTGIISVSILPISRSYSPQRALSRLRQSVELSVVVVVVVAVVVLTAVVIIHNVWMISQRQLAIRVVDSFGIRARGHAEDLVRVVSLVHHFSSRATTKREGFIPRRPGAAVDMFSSLSLSLSLSLFVCVCRALFARRVTPRDVFSPQTQKLHT